MVWRMGRPRLFDADAAIGSALDLFWRQGYGATSPDDLLEAMGIGKGSFYNAFDSKHAVFERALRRYGDDRVAGLADALAGPRPLRARIKSSFQRLAAPKNADQVRRGCFAANTAAELGQHDAGAAVIVRGIFTRMERLLEETLKNGQRKQELRSGVDPKDLASLVLAALVGLTVLAKVEDAGSRAKRIGAALAALL